MSESTEHSGQPPGSVPIGLSEAGPALHSPALAGFYGGAESAPMLSPEGCTPSIPVGVINIGLPLVSVAVPAPRAGEAACGRKSQVAVTGLAMV